MIVYRILFILVSLLCTALPVFSQNRSFSDLYPGMDEESQNRVFSEGGFNESRDDRLDVLLFKPDSVSDLDLIKALRDRDPTFVVESIRLIPYENDVPDLAAIYYALGQVRRLAGLTYRSSSKGEVPLFEEASRTDGPRSSKKIDDPGFPGPVPQSETMYLRLKDSNFGNSNYQADIQAGKSGLLYTLFNTRNLSYGFIPVIGDDKFVAVLYAEPLEEGLLVYAYTAAEVSGFVANRVNIPSAIRKRLEVIIEWLSNGTGANR